MTTFTVDPKNYPTPLELAEAGYRGYAEKTGGKTFDGRDMPAWKDLPERTIQAWVAAVVAIHAETARGTVLAQVQRGYEHIMDQYGQTQRAYDEGAQIATSCRTPGAEFHISIQPDRIECAVDLPVDLGLDETRAAVLEADLHNAVELVLASYWPERV